MKKKITAIVLAAGSGRRMGGDIPKQYMELSGKPVIYYSLKVFQDSAVDDIVLVVSDEYIEYCRKEIVERYGFSKVTDIKAVEGKDMIPYAMGLKSVRAQIMC